MHAVEIWIQLHSNAYVGGGHNGQVYEVCLLCYHYFFSSGEKTEHKQLILKSFYCPFLSSL